MTSHTVTSHPTAGTMREVAALAGVSAMTVSRVLNNSGQVAADKQERVREAVERLRYAPSTAARSLKRGRELRLAMAYTRSQILPVDELITGALEQAYIHNLRLLPVRFEPGGEQARANDLEAILPDAVLWCAQAGDAEPFRRYAKEAAIPFKALLDEQDVTSLPLPGTAEAIAGHAVSALNKKLRA